MTSSSDFIWYSSTLCISSTQSHTTDGSRKTATRQDSEYQTRISGYWFRHTFSILASSLSSGIFQLRHYQTSMKITLEESTNSLQSRKRTWSCLLFTSLQLLGLFLFGSIAIFTPWLKDGQVKRSSLSMLRKWDWAVQGHKDTQPTDLTSNRVEYIFPT